MDKAKPPKQPNSPTKSPTSKAIGSKTTASLSAKSSPSAVLPGQRRGFLAGIAAVVCGALVTAFPVLAGLVTFFDPLRRKTAEARPIRVVPLDGLLDDGLPHQYPIIAERRDAWTRYQAEPIGSVFLVREKGSQKVSAFSATCPHAGCLVSFVAAAGAISVLATTAPLMCKAFVLMAMRALARAIWIRWLAK